MHVHRRVANRIANATFELDGKTYRLSKNEAGMPGTLHGGSRGFDKVRWDAKRLDPHRRKHRRRGDAIQLRYRSAAGEEGYPGTVEIEVTYTLMEGSDGSLGQLVQSIHATTDEPTLLNVRCQQHSPPAQSTTARAYSDCRSPCVAAFAPAVSQLAQHSYFNLAGHGSGSVLDHTLTLPRSTHMLPIDEARIPTGQLAPVQQTAFDFTSEARLGGRITEVNGPGWRAGYDHCFVLHGRGPASLSKLRDTQWWTPTPRSAARLHDPASGRTMEISTNAPGLQLYTSNFLDGKLVGKGGKRYAKYGGVCLETQNFPDAIHHPGAFPSPVLRPGERYAHTTIYHFSVRRDGEQ